MSTEYFHTTCLSEDQMLRYISGKMSVAEQRKVEMHISDCELCSDALEGLRMIEKDHHHIVSQLKKSVADKLEKRKVRPLIAEWWQIAAILIVLAAGAGTLIYINSYAPDNSVSVLTNEQKSPPETKQNAGDESAPQNEAEIKGQLPTEGSVASKNNQELSGKEINHQERVEDAYQPSEKAAVEELHETDKTATLSGTGNAEPATPQLPAEKQVGYSDIVTTKKAESVKNTAPAPAAESTHSSALQDGINNFTEGKYEQAISHLLTAPESVSRTFYLGASYFELNDNTRSLKELDRVIDAGTSEFFENALWYKARLLLRTGKKQEAEQLFRRVSGLNGKHKPEADSTLQKL